MCVYLRFKFAGRLFVCDRMCSEVVTDVCAEELVVVELFALCRCLLELMSRISHSVWLYICHLSIY
jgi:hypothetical protein